MPRNRGAGPKFPDGDQGGNLTEEEMREKLEIFTQDFDNKAAGGTIESVMNKNEECLGKPVTVLCTPAVSSSTRVKLTPAITPKFDLRLPVTSSDRAPKPGERLMSLTGSPVYVQQINGVNFDSRSKMFLEEELKRLPAEDEKICIAKAMSIFGSVMKKKRTFSVETGEE